MVLSKQETKVGKKKKKMNKQEDKFYRIIKDYFPYEPITSTGSNYFPDYHNLLDLGLKLRQIWSVWEEEECNPYVLKVIRYGPAFSNTWTNGKDFWLQNGIFLGYIGTREFHNNETFYEETFHNSDIMAQGELPG